MNTAADFKKVDASSYDALAANFDHHTEKYSIYAVDRLLDLLDLTSSPTVLDIGCGTGVVALTAAQRAPSARITGLDLSDGMLAFAREKAATMDLGERVSFIKGDAEALELAADSIDAAVSLYAWRHLPNPAKATAEVFRVLRPGGTFAVAVGSGPKLLSADGLQSVLARPARILAKAGGRELSACDHIDALVARMLPLSGAAEEAAWTTGHHEFSGSLESMLAGAGFTVKTSGWVGRTFEVPSVDDFWDLQATFSSTARKRINAAGEAKAAAVRAEFDRECGAVLARGGRLVYRVGAAYVAASKPAARG